MSKYVVTFCQYYPYTVEAEDEDSAIDVAYEEYYNEKSYPTVSASYDEVEVEEIDED